MNMIDRRSFLAGVGAIAMGGASIAADDRKFRAAIIGHTGKGDYGHGLDVIFQGRSDVQVVAVADSDPGGRARAAEKCGALRQYENWRKLLETEKPQLVCIAPRQTPLRREMLLESLNTGAHIICEKPFVRSPADGDEVLALADQKHLKIAVMHQMRLAPAVVHLKKKLDQGLIGDLVEMHAWGKQDSRAGGEDLLVLGVHLFDLMRLFAGEPSWCTARVLQKGREATLADARKPTEDIGPVLGDEINAQFAFDDGVCGTFTSRARLRDHAGSWGLELIGSKASARILADIWPRVFISHTDKWSDAGRVEQWRPIEDDPANQASADQRSTALANTRIVDDWLGAIRQDRQPICSGANGAKAIEMVMAVWRAGLSGSRVSLPLSKRGHALG